MNEENMQLLLGTLARISDSLEGIEVDLRALLNRGTHNQDRHSPEEWSALQDHEAENMTREEWQASKKQ